MYRVCGLTIETSHAVRGLFPTNPHGPADVQVSFGSRPPWADFPSDPQAVLRRDSVTGDAPGGTQIAWVQGGWGVRFRHDDGCSFWVDAAGSRVWAEWTPALSLDDVSGYLAGSMLGYLSRRRGELALHASCVVIDGLAAAIVGPSSSGKSSLAASFVVGGDVVIADDVLALRCIEGVWFAFGGSDHVRLDDRSVEHIVPADGVELERVGPTWDKRMLPVTRAGAEIPAGPVPLAAIFVLEPNEDGVPALAARMTPPEAFRAVLPNTSSAGLLDPAQREREFQHVSALATQVPVFHLRTEIGFQRLEETKRVVRSTVRAVTPRA